MQCQCHTRVCDAALILPALPILFWYLSLPALQCVHVCPTAPGFSEPTSISNGFLEWVDVSSNPAKWSNSFSMEVVWGWNPSTSPSRSDLRGLLSSILVTLRTLGIIIPPSGFDWGWSKHTEMNMSHRLGSSRFRGQIFRAWLSNGADLPFFSIENSQFIHTSPEGGGHQADTGAQLKF